MRNWKAVRAAIKESKAIVWDGCHKIYVLMDEGQVETFEGYGYEDYFLRVGEDVGYGEAVRTVQRWFRESCPLRLVGGWSTVEGDPNKGYIQLINQFD